MENKKLQNGIKEINKIVMTPDEKKRVFENILKTGTSVKPIQSPWFGYSFVLMMKQTKLVYFILVPLIFILTGGGVVFASQDSLPDSILYPIKVSVIEPIEGALSFSPKAKAKHESKLASTRLIEAETLASHGKLDIKQEKKINKLLVSHTIALNKALDNADKSNDNKDTEEIATNFRAEMNAHARVLDIITEGDKQTENVDNNVNVNIDENIKISKNARVGAEKIKIRQDKKNFNNVDKYIKRKEEVKSLINIAGQGLEVAPISQTKIEQATVDGTNETLDQAKKYLEEADKKEKEGNSGEAYSSLLDSESSVKEADIFLKTRLNLKEKSNYEKDNNN